MGGSLSRQEELFASLQWSQLLEEAVQADMNEIMRDADAAGSGANSKDQRKIEGFTLSANEWQACLSILENKGDGRSRAAPSQLCQRLTSQQLHCPVVVLMVHACTWWQHAIDTAIFKARIHALVDLMETKQKERRQGRAAGVPATPENSGEEGDCWHEAEEESDITESTTDPSPPSTAPTKVSGSRQARFMQSIKSRLRRGGGGGDACNTQGTYQNEMSLLLTLYNALLDSSAETTTLAAAKAKSTAKPVSGDTTEEKQIERECTAAFCSLADMTNVDSSSSESRPVVKVAICLLLAVYATSAKSCFYAEAGAYQLQKLEAVMEQKPKHRQKQASASGGFVPAARQWTIVKELEKALVLRQYEVDALQCVTAEGRRVGRELHKIREDRIVGVAASGFEAAEALAAMTLKRRWAAVKTQYVGQGHIWEALETHFLSAGVFDTDKPTVIILFGPSGYGKSEMAKRIASAIHCCPVNDLEPSGKLVHLHMPSFCTRDSIYSLVDPPAAHVGDGILLSALLKQPDAVVVLDEFEKSTAEAIQNLWLSAFQKNGTLRSLKNASRCVSTVRTTFILTCNIGADSINSCAARYLSSSKDEQQTMRTTFENECRDTCRKMLSDPFVNRVDYFSPFVPYTYAQREEFVLIQVQRLLSTQEVKGRRVFVSPRFVSEMIEELKTFHSNAVEEVLRPLIANMARRSLSCAVLTVEQRASASHPRKFVLVPAFEKEVEADMAVQAKECGVDTEMDSAAATTTGVDGGASVAWDAIPGGPACLKRWGVEPLQEEPPVPATATTTTEAEATAAIRKAKDVPKVEVKKSAPTNSEEASVDAVDASGTKAASTGASMRRRGSAHGATTGTALAKSTTSQNEYELELQLEKNTEKLLEKQTERELVLAKELEYVKGLLLEKEKEIEYLKEKVLILQKALAVVLCTLLCTLMIVALFIGLKLTMLVVGAMCFVMFVLLKIPLSVVLDAVVGLFRFLGPFRSALVVGGLALWFASAFQIRDSVPCRW